MILAYLLKTFLNGFKLTLYITCSTVKFERFLSVANSSLGHIPRWSIIKEENKNSHNNWDACTDNVDSHQRNLLKKEKKEENLVAVLLYV